MKTTFIRFYRKISSLPGIDWVVLGAGLTTYAGLTLATITKSSIWFDEAFSAFIVRFNFFQIARYTATDVHPPFYYWILKIWTMLFGTSEVAFRSLSVLFGLTAIVFGFLLVKRLFGRRAAFVSLLFMAISPMLIRYGQEARMYHFGHDHRASSNLYFDVCREVKKPQTVGDLWHFGRSGYVDPLLYGPCLAVTLVMAIYCNASIRSSWCQTSQSLL